jgi:hypothetical protein
VVVVVVVVVVAAVVVVIRFSLIHCEHHDPEPVWELESFCMLRMLGALPLHSL